MRLSDPRILRLLTLLTRTQSWLSATQISKLFQFDRKTFTARTVHRWLADLRETSGFTYYPYPRANLLGLQDTLVYIRGLRNPGILNIIPFGAFFNAEVGLGDGKTYISQGYWVPRDAKAEFWDYWKAARDLGHLEEFEVVWLRNTHYLYSPLQAMVARDGRAVVEGSADNAYFAEVVLRHVQEDFKVRVSPWVAEAPLIVPIVLERIWSLYTARQLWEGIRAKGDAALKPYAKGKFARLLRRPGAGVQLLQQQWAALIRNFEEVFLQPRVSCNWFSLRNVTFLSLGAKPGSLEGMVELARRVSERSLVTTLKPGVAAESGCRISCYTPSDQLLPILKFLPEYHRDPSPPMVGLHDGDTATALYDRSYCKVDWRLFDPDTVSWRFDGDAYIERLKGLKPGD